MMGYWRFVYDTRLQMNPYKFICNVCGAESDSARGINIHFALKHRELVKVET